MLSDCYDKEPEWLAKVIRDLNAAGYDVEETNDGDGHAWHNRLYTVTKGGIHYAQRIRAQRLLTIPIV